MSKRTIRILALVLAAVIFGGAFWLFQTGFFSAETAAPPGKETGGSGMPKQENIPIKAMLIKSGELTDYISVNGSTVANEKVFVSSEVAGKITDIKFSEGMLVKKGAVLVQLDNQELQAQMRELQVRKDLTQKIAERLQGLYAKEGVSLQEYEIARAEADQVKAQISLLGVQIEKRTIRAPFEGLLGLRQVSDGAYLSPGSPIVELVSINPINIEFSIPEKYSRQVARGTRINFRLDGSDEKFSATVVAKEPNIDANTRTLKLKASAPNPQGRILPGAFTNISVNLSKSDKAIMIPTQAIIPELNGKKVYVYKSGKAEAVNIETGVRQDTYIQVTSGLSPGDTLITTGILQVKPGSDVTITEFE
ncbi:MAG: efflux RND transporter periplasmic adaptor subunit [Saprospiraceae bacterium]|nr:efflux RND transporter periplasmic adaptor subunit [Saprospiraceae bacterium]MDZ4706064.1 efflux RND transporter periplasmic adaptor subunit [Saprospiraceae bacterium]